jgi:FkbM family methyltransferase
MYNWESVKRSIPIVHLLPFSTLYIRLKEKIYHFRREHELLASKEISTDNQGNVLLKFRRDCKVAKKGDLLKVPRDKIIFEYLKNLGRWAQEESDFIVEQLNKFEDYASTKSVVVDMGANVGLISLQIARKANFVPEFIFVEPIPQHLEALKFNLSGNSEIKSYKICEYALAKSSAKGSIVINHFNLGASYVSNILPKNLGNDFTIESIQIKGINDFVLENLFGYERIFLKSDLEGFDLEVLGNLPSDYWNKVTAGVIEVISNKNSDMHALENILKQLDSFSVVTWNPYVRTKLSSLEISNFWLDSETYMTRNLFFTRT